MMLMKTGGLLESVIAFSCSRPPPLSLSPLETMEDDDDSDGTPSEG